MQGVLNVSLSLLLSCVVTWVFSSSFCLPSVGDGAFSTGMADVETGQVCVLMLSSAGSFQERSFFGVPFTAQHLLDPRLCRIKEISFEGKRGNGIISWHNSYHSPKDYGNLDIDKVILKN